jgi:hypothetical protein
MLSQVWGWVRRPSSIVALSLFVIAAVRPAAAFAQALGTITRLEGTAQVVRSGTTTAAALSMPIQLHDKIATGQNTYLTISMLGGSTLTISPNSSISMDESTTIGGAAAPTKVGLLKGGLHTLIMGAMRNASRTAFEVHTPNSVGAVRGTEWDEEYETGVPKAQQYRDCREFTEIWVEDGVVHISNSRLPNDSGKDVRRGQYSMVGCGYAPILYGAPAGAGIGAGAWAAAGAVPAVGAAVGITEGLTGGGSSGQKPQSPAF